MLGLEKWLNGGSFDKHCVEKQSVSTARRNRPFSPSDLADQGNELSRRTPEKGESSVLNAAATPLHKEA